MPDMNKTEILVILDASGSMQKEAVEAASGLNDFLAEQAKQPGECFVTVVQFNSLFPYKVIVDRVLAKDAPKFDASNYHCTGWTPLRQCVCQGIDNLGADLARKNEHERPGKVIVVIITDGMENSSPIQYTAYEVSRRIKHQEQTYSWKFIFLGKNIDAMYEGAKLGVNVGTTANYESLKAAFGRTAANVSRYRTTCNAIDLQYNDQDRVAMMQQS